MVRTEKLWSEVFEQELALIKSGELKKTVIQIFSERVHASHLTEPASSTGKYHPAFSNGEGGLIRHTKAVVWLTEDLLRARVDLIPTSEDHDAFIAAAILHDMGKYHDGALYTTHDHPAWMANVCEQYNLFAIARLIAPHMGIWNKSNRSNVELQVPCDEAQWLVHYADYIASRKWLSMQFDADDNLVK